MATNRHDRQPTIRPALTLLSVSRLRFEPGLLEMPRGRRQAVLSRRVALIAEPNKASETRCGHAAILIQRPACGRVRASTAPRCQRLPGNSAGRRVVWRWQSERPPRQLLLPRHLGRAASGPRTSLRVVAALCGPPLVVVVRQAPTYAPASPARSRSARRTAPGDTRSPAFWPCACRAGVGASPLVNERLWYPLGTLAPFRTSCKIEQTADLQGLQRG